MVRSGSNSAKSDRTGRTCKMIILVELASCQFHAYGHFGGTGILPVSCLLSSGQDAHSTPID
ncbi:hypothetical protein [Moorena producens]|uniref:hypothetical protein n=1 Tax=Moorena producens TaxID=1155739 RepID=UPI003C73B811